MSHGDQARTPSSRCEFLRTAVQFMSMNILRGAVACVGAALAIPNGAPAQPIGVEFWNQFRGAHGDGKAGQALLPAAFGEAKNVRWKTAIHDEGWSSPVVWDRQVWVTTGRRDGSRLFAVCVDLDTGAIVRNIKVFEVASPQVAYEGYNTHATPTPIIEERRIYLHFGAYGTVRLDTQSGERIWERGDLKCDHRVRPASSPIMDGDLVFLILDGVDVQFIVALDKKTGATRWQRDRKSGLDFSATLRAGGLADPMRVVEEKPNDNRKAYATPTVIEHQGKKQLVSPAGQVTISCEPSTGRELWRVRHEGWGWNSACRPIYENGLVYLTAGVAKQSLAIRPDGNGDVTDTHVVWKARKGVPSLSSPVTANGMLFMVEDKGGFVSSVDARTGREIWRARLGYGREHWASPLCVGSSIYCLSEQGEVTVIATEPELRTLANHKFEGTFIAGPAVAGHALIFRSESHLYRMSDD